MKALITIRTEERITDLRYPFGFLAVILKNRFSLQGEESTKLEESPISLLNNSVEDRVRLSLFSLILWS